MKTEKQAEELVEFYKARNTCKKFCGSRRIYAKRSPEPDDIIWENVPYSKAKRRVIIYAIYTG